MLSLGFLSVFGFERSLRFCLWTIAVHRPPVFKVQLVEAVHKVARRGTLAARNLARHGPRPRKIEILQSFNYRLFLVLHESPALSVSLFG